MPRGPIEIRPVRDDELLTFRDSIYGGFGGDPETDPNYPERVRALVPAGRLIGAFDGASLVATSGTFPFAMSVPGGALPIAGLTAVTVRATHRRRGILRGLIDAHLDDARRHREPASALWASEASIYGRFGYGVASEGDELAFSAPALQLVGEPASDDVELIDLGVAAKILPDLHQRVAATRPGMMSRPPAWWTYRRFQERAEQRKGAGPRTHALVSRDGVAVGYAAYRLRPAWTDGVACGGVEIDELVALDLRAELTLWRFLGHIDLFPNVSWWNAPVDSILPWVATDARRLRRHRTDGMWLRIDDIAAVLPARRYLDDGALRLEIVDSAHATDAAVFELRVDGGQATCQRSDGAPDLRLDRATLGTIYLNAAVPSALACAGRITGRAAALTMADRLFRWPVAPWCLEVF